MPTTMKLTAYGGMNIPVIGKCDMSIKHKTSTIQADFYVVRVPGGKPIIGLPTSRELNLINVKDLHEVNKDCGQDILDTYADVLTGLGLVDGEYYIEINEDVKPVIHASRKIPLSLIPKLRETLDNLEKSGVV